MRSCVDGEGDTKMKNAKQGRRSVGFKQGVVRPVGPGQKIVEMARSLGIGEQMLSNWVKGQREGRLKKVPVGLE
jgi:transposase